MLGYKNQAWIRKDLAVLYTMGSFGQLIAADYRHRVVITFMGNWRTNSDQQWWCNLSSVN